MKPQPAIYDAPGMSLEDSNKARMAAIARRDTIHGGAKALVYSKRLDRMQTRIDYGEIVAGVYSASTGKHSQEFEAWECPECGSAHLGIDNAYACCVEGTI